MYIRKRFGLWNAITMLIASIALFSGTFQMAQAANEQEQLVEKAKLTVETLAAQTDMAQFRKLLAVSKGIVVFPQVLKAGFIVGGAGGSGVLLSRKENSDWSSPAFYTMGQASFGLQIGAEAKELVLVIMTDKGLKAIINNQVKLGADVSAAVGPVGKDLGASSTTNMKADIFSFAKNAGLFIGASVEGSILDAKEGWNASYYGKSVSVDDIVIHRNVDISHANPLKAALKAAEAP
ncbi:lipid-binding SYLF domain-containing protein [Sneathiella sp.]|jgi:lipid-binding SYLF domain-containing protein|uniref:lipid-binding SYLF domain-containing protein n=1 Tax=Sneathiella sp. TaxID=1964365 RepID=UPI0039E652C0